jgi:hypothetical protein
MEQKMHKFPSIEQYRNVIQQIDYRARYRGQTQDGDPIIDEGEVEMPTLSFRGTVKLHGTNAAIVYTWDMLQHNYVMHAQSRKNIITPMSDNAGFAAFVHTSDTEAILSQIMRQVGDDAGYTPEVIRVYGEWCGGNIQKGVALNGLDKMFVIFAIKMDKVWLSDESLVKIKMPEGRIYNILDYPSYTIDIDFNNPKESTNKLVELTNSVEAACPVGKAFGNDGIGEGIVWRCITEGYTSSKYWFKVKGEKHQSSKTKTLAPVDIERVNNIKELVSTFVTESRLNQGLEQMRMENLEISRKNLGFFLKWIVSDIVKEELDTIMGNGFEPKELNGQISKVAREWFFEQEMKQVGL